VDAEVTLGRAPENSLAGIYNGRPLRRLRQYWMLKSRGLPALCRHCLVPRCPTPVAWIGREEWNAAKGDRMSVTAKLTLSQNKHLHGDRL
jgi:hypothetical protein